MRNRDKLVPPWYILHGFLQRSFGQSNWSLGSLLINRSASRLFYYLEGYQFIKLL